MLIERERIQLYKWLYFDLPLADISLCPNPLRVNKPFLLMAQEHERHELTDFQKGEIVEGPSSHHTLKLLAT